MSKKSVRKPVCKALDGDAPVKHQIAHLFWLLAPAFTRWAESQMPHKELTSQRVRLMLPLLENGPMAMSALRDELGVSATNITALVDALEKDGMVKRRPHKTDRRSTLIEITAKAEKKLNENCSQFTNQVSEIFSCFSATEQKQFKNLLDQMRQALIKEHILKE
jgi:DNA-binding MarR family transcriptional regulator